MMPFGFKRPPYDQKQEADKATHHYCWDLLPKDRDMLLAWLERRKVPTIAERDMLAKKLQQAQRREGPPLPVVPSLDIKRAERLAKQRGSSLAEFIFDGAPEPPDQAA